MGGWGGGVGGIEGGCKLLLGHLRGYLCVVCVWSGVSRYQFALPCRALDI